MSSEKTSIPSSSFSEAATGATTGVTTGAATRVATDVAVSPAGLFAVPILSVRDLKKTYPGGNEAVRGLSFDVKQGICFGLLGPNGAGKTTTIEILEGIIERTSGDVLYRGLPVDEKYRQEIGIQFQQTSLPDFLSTAEVIRLFSSFYPKALPFDKIVEDCGLQELLKREPRKLSGGQRQRVLLALALVNDPEVIFLDEPTTGLDPQARRQFWDLVTKIKARGKTLILTTHYMDEAEILCDEIAIVDRGQLIAMGRPNELLRKHFSGAMIGVTVTSDQEQKVSLRFERECQASVESVYNVRNSAGKFEIETQDVNGALKILMEEGLTLDGLKIKSPTLEDLFLKLTGRQLAGEALP